MSGGYLDYNQYRINDMVETLELFTKGEYFQEYTEAVKQEIYTGIELLKKSAIYAQRIDWLISGDDGEDSFLKRLKEDLKELRNDKI